jgi:hypothetical protein
MNYTALHEYNLSQQPHRYGVGLPATIAPTPVGAEYTPSSFAAERL